MNEVTVAICAYNCAKYIEETLHCIINQSFQNFDLLIVSDCSNDNTRELIINFFEKHPRHFKLIDFAENRGLACGRKFVEQNTTTKYILFIDADDCPYSTMFEKLYNKIKSDDELMVVGCYVEFIDSNGRKIAGGHYLGDKTKDDFYARAKKNKLIFLSSSSIFNREIALSVGGRSTEGFIEGKIRYQDLCEDLDLWTRMSDLYVERKAIIVFPEVLLRYRKHESSLSTNSLNMTLRMSHIKTNLLRRRNGLPESSFKAFYSSLSEREMEILKQKSKAADYFRDSIWFLRKKKVFPAALTLIKSIWVNPEYAFQKIKHNLKISIINS